MNKVKAENRGCPLLYTAVSHDQLEVARYLLEQGEDRDEAGWYNNDTPLHNATHRGRLDLVRLLVEYGADMDIANNRGETPLRMAVDSVGGNLDSLRYLLEQGADVNKADNDGNTPLLYAVKMGNYYNSSNAFLSVMRYLLKQGADRDKTNNDGETPLHIAVAVWSGLERAKLLMVYGADLNVRNNQGHLPIDVAHTEEMKQAIRDEPRRRIDEVPGKRATEQDRHSNAATSANAQQEDVQINKLPRLEEGEADVRKVAEEEEDSEPSSHEEDDD